MSKWIKKDDKIVVIAGNSRGKTGSVLSRKGDRITIQGINVRKKHVKKKNQAAGSGILEYEMPIHISNVSLCDSEGRPVKLKVRTSGENKTLFYIAEGKEVIHRQIKKK